MKAIIYLLLCTLCVSAAEVPVGEVMKFNFTESKIYPGTMRDVWVYVPKQYDGKTPACLWVNQDGIQFGAVKLDKEGKVIEAGAFDKLIAEKKMPVTIGVFVKPGVAKALIPNALDRINRSYEYDSLGDNYAKFLIDELLPAVEKMTTPDGRKLLLSKDPNDRGIGGSSSGAICAFTVAWERPDSFRRVFSSIGSYADLRGGHNYPNLIRKMEPKPLRIFLEDGSGDQSNYAGDWWLGNQQMESALKFMGYEVASKWGDGGHDQKHATSIFTEAMAWLWKDHPQPVKTGECKNDFLKDILIPGEDWKEEAGKFELVYQIASCPKGTVYVDDRKQQKIIQLLDGKAKTWSDHPSKSTRIQCFGPDNRLYSADDESKTIIAWDINTETSETYLSGIQAFHCIFMGDKSIYTFAYNRNREGDSAQEIWHIKPDNERKLVYEKVGLGYGIYSMAVSIDKSQLFLGDYTKGSIFSMQINETGELQSKQTICQLQRINEEVPYVYLLACDDKNRIWIASNQGIQICDREGRIHCILSTPNGISYGLAMGGPDLKQLFVTSKDKVYSRKINAKYVNSFDPPIKPAAPKKK